MIYNLPKLKLFLLQKRYSEICKLIVLVQDHLNSLVKINYLEFQERKPYLSQHQMQHQIILLLKMKQVLLKVV